jgi:DNA-directed RNA polymerase subunit RPC12/RpoP
MEKYKVNKNNFKNYCVACGKPNVTTEETYLIRGNYCPNCSGKIQEKSKKLKYE